MRRGVEIKMNRMNFKTSLIHTYYLKIETWQTNMNKEEVSICKGVQGEIYRSKQCGFKAKIQIQL